MDGSAAGFHWSLHDLLPEGIGQLEIILGKIESAVLEIESYRKNLDQDLSGEDYLVLLQKIEGLRELTNTAGGYAYLNYAENTQNPEALSLQDRVNQALTEANNRTLFFSLWFKSLPDEAAGQYISAAGELSYYLKSLRRFKPFTLSEAEEKVINLKDVNGCDALVKIYEIITNGFSFNLEVNGEVKKLTRDGLTRYYRHPSSEIRAAGYQELYRVFADHRAALAQIYSSLVRDWHSDEIDLRGYASPISVRNLHNNIPDTVVTSLLDVCRRNASLFQRYFRLKARMLGMEKLRRYDIYAPLTHSDKEIGLQNAISMILSCFRQFSPHMQTAAEQVINRSHLDTELRRGKRGGAFSYSVGPKFTPWVSVNYGRHLRDATTLAHELGHAVHAVLSSNHSILTMSAPLPLAETASVFAEMLVTDHLLNEESDPTAEGGLLTAILDDAYTTIQRQAFLSIFEIEAHDRIAAGCTSDELAEVYLRQLQEQFGDGLELSDEFAWEWLTIPHIYKTPFYTYAYSFGQLLVLALYRQYLNEGEAFVPRYLKLLSYGGSAEPRTILEEAGLDIESAEFWQGGFDILKSRLDQLEQIVGG